MNTKAMNRISVCDPMRWCFLRTILLFALLPVHTIMAQHTMSFHYADSLTFRLYEQQQWAELSRAGNKAIDEGHDYYYLRMRTGIAHFMLQHYRTAASEFEKALWHNSGSQYAYDYLHLCYTWGGLETEALALEKRFENLAKNTGKTAKIIREVSIFSGASVSGSPDKLQDINLGEIYGEVTGNGNLWFIHAGAKVSPASPYFFYLGYTQMQLSKLQRVVMNGIDTLDHDFRLKQNQIFFNMPLHLAKGWHITPAVSLINVSEQPMIVSYDTIGLKYQFRKTDISLKNYLMSLRIIKEMPYFNLGLAAAHSNLNHANQWQGTLLAGLYPFANLNLYGLARIAALAENDEVNWHFRLIAGSRVHSWLWLQGSHHFGHLINAHEDNGLLVFNTSAEVVSRSTATAFFLINEKLTLQIDYSFVKQQDHYIEYSDTSNYLLNSFKYNNHHIMGGLKWKL
jgi:tetratricopeptide (TPR) repeat protein